MRTKFTFFALAAIALALLVSVFAWVRRPTDPVAAFMAERYGDYDATDKRWTTHPVVQGQLAYRVCARREIGIKGRTHIMLAACGAESGAQDGNDTSVDLYVLTQERGRASVAASLADAQNFSGSVHASSVEVVRLGREFFGFEIVSNFVAQGYVISGMTIFAPVKDTLKDTLSMSIEMDNGGTSECVESDADCVVVERTVRIGDNDPTLRVFPIEVVESRKSGHAPGQPTERKVLLRFDAKQWKFIAPRDFELTLG